MSTFASKTLRAIFILGMLINLLGNRSLQAFPRIPLTESEESFPRESQFGETPLSSEVVYDDGGREADRHVFRERNRKLASVTQDVQLVDKGDVFIGRKGVQEFAITSNNTGFFPSAFFVSQNIPVRLFLTTTSKDASCFVLDAFNVKTAVRRDKIQEITFNPSTPGVFKFSCPVDGIEGRLVVKERMPNE